jgi:membrane protein DedA with SNARE-associated domain
MAVILADVLSRLHDVAGHLGPWVYVIVLSIAVLEGAAFLGLVLPGETVLFLAGVLAFQGQIQLVPAIVLAVLGAIIGDSVGYELGRHFGSAMEQSWLGRKVGDKRWKQARDSLRDKGGKAIFVGRFVAVARALLPAAAGNSHMPYGTFLG